VDRHQNDICIRILQTSDLRQDLDRIATGVRIPRFVRAVREDPKEEDCFTPVPKRGVFVSLR